MGEIIVGIDIGTTKVCALIGEMEDGDNLVVLGSGVEVCTGVKRGVVHDAEATGKSIRASISQAEKMANLEVESAYVNIVGAYTDILNKTAVVDVSDGRKKITQKDIENVFLSIKELELSNGKQIIDIIPKQYILDNQRDVRDPFGENADRLGLEADLIIGDGEAFENIVRSLRFAGLELNGIVIDALAAAEIALTSEEKEQGVILLDVGGGITNVSFFEANEMIFSGSVPLGGDSITNDILIGLEVQREEAENLKKEYEICDMTIVKNDTDVLLGDGNSDVRRSVKISEIVEIIEARVYEIFTLCFNLLYKSDVLKNYNGGIVLTGGGVSYVNGCEELAEKVFGLKTRVANFKNFGFIKPEYVTATGIIKYVYNQKRDTLTVKKNLGVRYIGKFRESGTFIWKIGKIFSEIF